jgi:hypothetical protein
MPESGNLYYEGFNKFKVIVFLASLCVLFSGKVLHAQNIPIDDSVITRKTIDPATLDSAYHNPKKAAIMSAIVPGLGQIYNKKYWKVPIIYAGFITMGYFIQWNSKNYKIWRQAYIDYDSSYYKPPASFPLDKEQVSLGKDHYRRQMELSIIITAGFYILQIIDATVDGYLFNWSVGEDLSLRLEPSINTFPGYTSLTKANSFGLRACLSF